MRLTMRTNLAMRVLMACAVNDRHMVRRADIARVAGASENHLAQVVHHLSLHGFVDTIRGRSGGMSLARPAEEISIGQVFRQFEDVVPFAECFSRGENTCPLAGACRLRVALKSALDAFYSELDGISLADLVCDNAALEALLALPQTAPRFAMECAPRH
ncbi:Rrf2 family transcriptional regulator [Celeribacter arenosi]|uniref:Rrf2 family transcriptional regulator n=1 Tax=Celeribacter arenosi TaxID=792649 RepID=A0ABP7KJJ1_9RHOB